MRATPEFPVYVFWDISNIYVQSAYLALARDKQNSLRYPKMQFDALYKLATASRRVKGAFAVGSPTLSKCADLNELAEEENISIESYELGEKNFKEQGVDQCLQVHMLRALVDENEPAIAVLLSGDGAGYSDGIGFHRDLERMYNGGWGIEVLSWGRSMGKDFKEWVEEVGVFIKLDDYYDQITYISGGRFSKTLSLKNRHKAKVRKGTDLYKRWESRIKEENKTKYNSRFARSRK